MNAHESRLRRDALAKILMEEEGWRDYPYDDATGARVSPPVGKLTVGYGTLFPLRESEGAWLLRWRMEGELDRLKHELMTLSVDGDHVELDALPRLAWLALGDMAYQLDATGVLEFHRLLAHVARSEWREAADECRRSRWHKQTPSRCERVAARFTQLAEESQ